MKRLLMVFALMLAVSLLTLPANAAITIFSDRVSFDAAFPTANIQGWDSYAAGTTFTNGVAVDGITYNSSAGISIVASGYLNTTNPNSLGRTDLNYFEALDTITFAFSSPINYFGIDINTYATANGSYYASDGVNSISSYFDAFPGYDTGQFVGFFSDAYFTSVTIGGSSNSYTLDTMRYGTQPVPEPGTMLLLGSGLVGLVGYGRRRFKK